MSEEEIIKYIKDEIENEIDTYHWFDDMPENKTRKQIEESINAHQGLLDLYNKEKEKNIQDMIKDIECSNFIKGRYISKDKIKVIADDYESKGYIEIAGAMRELLKERN